METGGNKMHAQEEFIIHYINNILKIIKCYELESSTDPIFI